jgi:GT2 family glycosyltransferase
MSAVLVSPTYWAVDALCARSLRVAIMSASSHGLTWAGDASQDRLGYAFTRNLSASILRKDPDAADGIMWVDSDIMVPPNMIIRLLNTARVNKLDFLTGVYHSRKPPNLPIAYHWHPKIGMYLQILTYPKDTVLSLDACGFGFVWTSSKLINAIADHANFSPKSGWFPDLRDSGGFGEDISFCDQARKAGFQLYMDTGVQVGHLGDTEVITEKEFRARNLNLDSPEVQERIAQPNWGAKA